jgi:hypothetical protein
MEVLHKYFYYHPMDCVWMSHLTGCKDTVHEIEQMLNAEEGLELQGPPGDGADSMGGAMLSEQLSIDELTMLVLMPTLKRLQAWEPRPGFDESRWNKCIHWLAGDPAMTETEGSIVDRMQRIGPPSGGKLGEWEIFKHYAEAIMDDGCHRPASDVMDIRPTFETTMSCPLHPMENHGERMFVPPISAQTTSRDNAIEYDGIDTTAMDTDRNMFVNSAHRDRKSDCGAENTEKEMDADTLIGPPRRTTSENTPEVWHCAYEPCKIGRTTSNMFERTLNDL